jgi:hypothetical protein
VASVDWTEFVASGRAVLRDAGLAETGISLSYGPAECTCLRAINTDSKKRDSFVAPLFAAGRTFGTICHQI